MVLWTLNSMSIYNYKMSQGSSTSLAVINARFLDYLQESILFSLSGLICYSRATNQQLNLFMKMVQEKAKEYLLNSSISLPTPFPRLNQRVPVTADPLKPSGKLSTKTTIKTGILFVLRATLTECILLQSTTNTQQCLSTVSITFMQDTPLHDNPLSLISIWFRS